MTALVPDAVMPPSIDSNSAQKVSVISGLFASADIDACEPVAIANPATAALAAATFNALTAQALDTQPTGFERLVFTIASSTAATGAEIDILVDAVIVETIVIGTSGATVDGIYASTGSYPAVITITTSGTITLGTVAVSGISEGVVAPAAGLPVLGISPRAALAGEPVSVYGPGVRFRYVASGLTPGAPIYVGDTGGYDDAAQTGDSAGLLVAVNATDLVLLSAVTA